MGRFTNTLQSVLTTLRQPSASAHVLSTSGLSTTSSTETSHATNSGDNSLNVVIDVFQIILAAVGIGTAIYYGRQQVKSFRNRLGSESHGLPDVESQSHHAVHQVNRTDVSLKHGRSLTGAVEHKAMEGGAETDRGRAVPDDDRSKDA
ncbi:hypothetical protein BAUCODRAFT_149279 [Baudoinia panamericana UAMH 10762]|uniref:Uncharacterized protein n=1 Tax=Baudoinia panamericana (strain UAMH 10762) TaxID=717646 RepID=M2MF68_BAUPA|nr:uncharacterized protein BAUCODRAFT_149279 [Baudoinia panamericana UAMH 10762]EMC95276.1 hypothetical protein BAUCODRAFT_149279 [Baudoinia panamericana UAMH 10762]